MNAHTHRCIMELLRDEGSSCANMCFGFIGFINEDITENYIPDVSSKTISIFLRCSATAATYTLFKDALLVIYRPAHCCHHLFAIVYIPNVILCIKSYRYMLYRHLVQVDNQWIHKLVCQLLPGWFYEITAVHAHNPMYHRPISPDSFMWPFCFTIICTILDNLQLRWNHSLRIL